jgi:hypothetical protein
VNSTLSWNTSSFSIYSATSDTIKSTSTYLPGTTSSTIPHDSAPIVQISSSSTLSISASTPLSADKILSSKDMSTSSFMRTQVSLLSPGNATDPRPANELPKKTVSPNGVSIAASGTFILALSSSSSHGAETYTTKKTFHPDSTSLESPLRSVTRTQNNTTDQTPAGMASRKPITSATLMPEETSHSNKTVKIVTAASQPTASWNGTSCKPFELSNYQSITSMQKLPVQICDDMEQKGFDDYADRCLGAYCLYSLASAFSSYDLYNTSKSILTKTRIDYVGVYSGDLLVTRTPWTRIGTCAYALSRILWQHAY